MKATIQNFSLEASDERIRYILDSADNAYADSAEIPHPGSLTYDNGFHVDCAAVFIDQVSRQAYNKLSEGHKKLLTSAALTSLSQSRYEGNFVSYDMASWNAGKSGASGVT